MLYDGLQAENNRSSKRNRRYLDTEGNIPVYYRYDKGELSVIDYKQKIIEMINEIHTERFLKMIYGFVRGAYREEKA